MFRPVRDFLHRLTTALALVAVGMVVTAAPTLAQQASGSVGLRGTMETICFVTVTQNNAAIDIVKGVANLTVASVGEKCNLGNGFKVSISSANAGAMVDALGNRAPYTIQYDNSGKKALTTPVVLTRTSAKKTVSTKTFKVNFTAKPDAVAGDYGDTITVTIAAR